MWNVITQMYYTKVLEGMVKVQPINELGLPTCFVCKSCNAGKTSKIKTKNTVPIRAPLLLANPFPTDRFIN